MLITPVQTFGEYNKLSVILVTDDQYPQTLAIEFGGQKLGLVENMGYTAGDSVEIHYNLRGREWTSPTGEVKYFSSIEGWKIDKLGNAPTVATPEYEDPLKPQSFADSLDSNSDELPF